MAAANNGTLMTTDAEGRRCCVLCEMNLPNPLNPIVWSGCPFKDGRTIAVPADASTVPNKTKRFLLHHHVATTWHAVFGAGFRVTLPDCIVCAIREACPNPEGFACTTTVTVTRS